MRREVGPHGCREICCILLDLSIGVLVSVRAAGTVLHVGDRDCGRVTFDGVSLPRMEGSTIPALEGCDERCLRGDVVVLESALAAVPSGDRLEDLRQVSTEQRTTRASAGTIKSRRSITPSQSRD